MGCTDPRLDEALEKIEEMMLPTIAVMLDTVLDAAALGQPGVDADAYAEELGGIAREIETLTRQFEAISAAPNEVGDYRAASAA